MDSQILKDPVLGKVSKSISLSEQMELVSKSLSSLEIEILPDSPRRDTAIIKKFEKPKFNVGDEFDVKVIACEEGPWSFYVQFKSNEILELKNALKESLKNASLAPLEAPLRPGMTCIAAVNPDEVSRAVVESVDKDQVRIFLLDEGIHMIVEPTSLFRSTENLFDVLPFAVNFKMYDLGKIEALEREEMIFYFRYLILKKDVKLLVKEAPERGEARTRRGHFQFLSLKIVENSESVPALSKKLN